MGISTKKKAVGSPIEDLLKKSPLLPTDASFVSASLEKLQSMRQLYMEQNNKAKSVFSLPARTAKRK